MTATLVGVPIKPFGVAKARLATVLDRRSRAILGRQVAAHTAKVVASSGAEVAIVTGDDGVARWARRRGWRIIRERAGDGLDGAARALVGAVPEGDPWAFLHADLPLLCPEDLVASWEALATGPVIAPSHDGGTSMVAGRGHFPFSYGPGSFSRHLATAPTSTVVVRPGLALDLDTAEDLAVAVSLPPGAWLAPLLRGRALV